MKKRNNRDIWDIYRKRAVRQTLSVFCTAILIICQILLAAAPLTVMGAAVMSEDGSAVVRRQWMTEDTPEYAPEGEAAGEELLQQESFSESSAASSDNMEYTEQETDQVPERSSMSDSGSPGNEDIPAADVYLTGESGSGGSMPEDLSDEESAEENGAGETTFGEVSSDEVSSGEMSSTEIPTDEISSDEMPSDEMPSDEMPSDEMQTDEMPSDEMSSFDTSAQVDVSDESAAYETDADSGAWQEVAEDDTAEAGPDGTVPSGSFYEGSVTGDAATGNALSEEATGEFADSIDADSIFEIIEGEEAPESVIPLENGSADTDNDDIFAGYVCRELEVKEDFIEDIPEAEILPNGNGESGEKAEAYSDSDSESVSSPALRSNYASTRLTGFTKTLYDRLLVVIRQISAGERAETTIELSAEELELDGLSWSAEELGVDSLLGVNDEGNSVVTKETATAIRNCIGISYADANRALLADCPYDLYWYDKTISSTAVFNKYSTFKSSGELRIKVKSYLVKMPVSPDYSADGAAETYYVNTSIGSSVTEAYNNARAIVEQYSDLTDYRKLDAYRQEICSRTSYNYTAIRENADYGDPWQLIYALDNDTTNQVVCEGYSKAFQYLCDLSSFNSIFQECISVTGMLGSEGHMWNVVSLRDGTNYLVDLTNCDSGMVGSKNGGRGLFLVGTGTADNHNYYCTGNVTSGYKFNLSASGPKYTYDQNAFSRFGEEILTLSEGKVVLGDAELTVEIPDGGIGYDGTEKEPKVIVKSKNRIFNEGSDYTVEYFNNIDIGENTAQALITALDDGRCLDSAMVTFSIDKGIQKLQASNLKVAVQDQALISVSGSQGELTFTCSDPSIIEVGEKDGIVKGVSLGTAKVTISAAQTDHYNAAQIEINVTVGTPLSAAEITLDIPEDGYVYDGTEKRPKVNVSYVNRTFTEGRDYTVEYLNNIDAGENTAQALVTALEDGCFLDSAAVDFSIARCKQTLLASDLELTAPEEKQIEVSGAQGELTFTSSDPSIAEVDAKDGTVRGAGPGTAKVTISAAQTGNYYAAQIEINVTVRTPLSAAGITTTISSEKQVYDGKAKMPAVSLADKGIRLTKDRDYTLTYSNNVNAGTNVGLITITGIGKYSGVIKKYFTIYKAKQSLSARAHASSVAVGKGTLIYVDGAKGNVTYSSSNTAVADVSKAGKITAKKIGTSVITVRSAETNNFLEASAKITISVVPADTASFTASNRQLGILLSWKKVAGATGYDIYRGSAKIKTIQGGSVLSFQDNDTLTNGTRYTYMIYARASTGVSTLRRSVSIYRLTRPSISSLYNAAPGKMIVTWAKNARATKYQVQYSLYSDFRSSGTVNVMGASTLKTVIKGLSRNRVRYVRIRTCKTVGNVTYASMWSVTRSVKILK